MSIVINNSGGLEVGPAGDDPSRQGNARLAADLHWFFEQCLAADDCNDARIIALTQRVEFLETLLAAPAPPRRARGRLCAHADQDGEGMHWLEEGERCGRVVQL
jgi:hypothetical protein